MSVIFKNGRAYGGGSGSVQTQNNLTTTDEGYALDARQGKILSEKIEELLSISYLSIAASGTISLSNIADKSLLIFCPEIYGYCLQPIVIPIRYFNDTNMKYSCRLKDAIEENSTLFTISYNASNDTIIYTSTLTDMYYFRIYAL